MKSKYNNNDQVIVTKTEDFNGLKVSKNTKGTVERSKTHRDDMVYVKFENGYSQMFPKTSLKNIK